MAQHVWLYGGDADPTDTLATIHSGELAPVRVELADGCLTKIVLASRAGGLEESVGQIAGAIVRLRTTAMTNDGLLWAAMLFCLPVGMALTDAWMKAQTVRRANSGSPESDADKAVASMLA